MKNLNKLDTIDEWIGLAAEKLDFATSDPQPNQKCEWRLRGVMNLHQCLNCGNPYYSNRRKKTKYCTKECGAIYRNRLNAGRNVSILNGGLDLHMECANCGDIFSGRKRKFCSIKCKTRYQNRKRLGRDVSVFERPEDITRDTSSPRPVITCGHCGEMFKARTQTIKAGGKSRQQRQKYCSRVCSDIGRRGQSPKKSAVQLIQIEISRLCRIKGNVGFDRNKSRYIITRHMNANRINRRTRNCKVCSSMYFMPHKGSLFCGDECKKKAILQSRRRCKNTSNKSHKRRAEKYGVPYEKVDRIKVFEQCGWKCANCDKDTPKSLMRTFDNMDAPTLDHIIPMSKGGHHSYENIQLLCRMCNSVKSDSIDVLV